MESLAQTFKALSDPLRLRLLNLLSQKDSLCVCELVDILQQNQSTVSRHLSYLKNSGLVSAWRDGVWMHYSLNKEPLELLNVERLSQRLLTIDVIQKDNVRLQHAGVLSCEKPK